MRTWAELKAAGRVRCPSCGARADARCRGEAGDPTEYHQARYVAGAAAPTAITAARTLRRRKLAAVKEPRCEQPAWQLVDEPEAPNAPWLLVDEPEAPNAPQRELDVHFSERRASGVKVTISARAAEAIAGFLTRRGGFTEEGGMLVGRPRSFRGEITITEAGGPGPCSRRTATNYRPDRGHDLAFLAERRKWLATDLRESGNWHLHPPLDSTTTPGSGDLQHYARMLNRSSERYFIGVILAPRINGFAASAWVTEEGHPGARDPWYVCRPAELIIEGKSWS